jgi:hypothetical protein
MSTLQKLNKFENGVDNSKTMCSFPFILKPECSMKAWNASKEVKSEESEL